mmetsp:Transcript_20761/g.66826  ORF Transcript_20761/g.66826 Transcript_20761/m.66826 type:complete len:240 (+) Transcript_20761:157-876(+)|eukprot:CAMPEP_0118902696 /NCGR_PEP_ID=MMETSP1166-20130328/7867_1 /TAXON_ID=1104430 /ORGANISM="Chrysoreinhardia sp, Strain CCMP3193" /LENGTH=239 /DNA_ID=CAMNT_0006841909 /DNA_START=162 /DNA_END=881 /DNA_ORIENTATION=+
MRQLAFLVVTTVVTTTSAGACPKAASEVVDEWVWKNWSPAMMAGTFYEVALRDPTQPRVCGCERSVKAVDAEGAISDTFSIRCPPTAAGTDYVVPLAFVQTGTPGLMDATCNFLEPFGTTTCPDYVVDVGTRRPGEPYPWVIEFQCVERTDRRQPGSLLFAGINFYSRSPDDPRALEAMNASAYAHGLGPFIDGGRGLYVVNHTGCTYPDVVPSSARGGGEGNLRRPIESRAPYLSSAV